MAGITISAEQDEPGLPSLIGEVQAVSVAMVDRPIEEVGALAAEIIAGVGCRRQHSPEKHERRDLESRRPNALS